MYSSSINIHGKYRQMNKKNKLVIIRLTENEKASIQEKANQIGMSLTDVIRHGLRTINAIK
jgi:hypothetical protein